MTQTEKKITLKPTCEFITALETETFCGEPAVLGMMNPWRANFDDLTPFSLCAEHYEVMDGDKLILSEQREIHAFFAGREVGRSEGKK